MAPCLANGGTSFAVLRLLRQHYRTNVTAAYERSHVCECGQMRNWPNTPLSFPVLGIITARPRQVKSKPE